MIIIPDVHGRDFWKRAVEGHEDEEIVFWGDYVDPYGHEGISPECGLQSLLEVLEFKKQHMANVTLLLGNHDLGYVEDSICDCRRDYENYDAISALISENLELFCMAYEKTIAGRRYIFSHAGILPEWIENNEAFFAAVSPDNAVDVLNRGLETGDIFEALADVSAYRGGYTEAGSCVWADVHEHIYKAKEDGPWAEVYQVFGHTQQPCEPIITQEFACLDCRRAFELKDDGQFDDICD